MEINRKLFLLLAVSANAKVVDHSDAVRLKRDIFANYSKDVRPLRDQSEAIVVWFDMYFINIQELDMRTQLLISNGWHNLTWTDEFLTWKPAEYGGIREMYVYQDRIWLPSIVFYNTKTTTPGRVIGSHSNMLVRISSSGAVKWEPDFSLESTCKVDITHFPFDIQMCEIRFCSWSMLNSALKIQQKENGGDFMNYALQNGEFFADGFNCTMGDWSVDLVICRLRLTRRVNFYIFSLLIPLVILSFLSLASFLVPAESGEKLTVSMTTLLSFTVYLGVLDTIMPKTSDNVSILMTYVTMLMIISLMSVLGNATVLYLYHRYEGKDEVRIQETQQNVAVRNKRSSPLALQENPVCTQTSSQHKGEQNKCLCLGILTDRIKTKNTLNTSERRSVNVEKSRFVNKIFLTVLTLILCVTMICIAALYKYF